jgi:hypothetical protein
MFENILYATDFTESPFMLPCIGIIGKTRRIHLLHVISDDTQIDPQLFEPRMLEAKSFLEEQLNGERNKGIEVDVHLMPGTPARGICDVAKTLDASLIVLNYHPPEGPIASSVTDLVKNCNRNLLVMTTLASDTVDRSGEKLDEYCSNLFRCVASPASGDISKRIGALKSIKEESSLGTVVFSGFSDATHKDAKAMSNAASSAGIGASAVLKKGLPPASLVSAAEGADASIILLDARAELGLALAVVGISPLPVLVIRSL